MEKRGYQSFEQLEIWRKARELKNEIFEEVKKIPADEKYRLADQLIKSSRSVNSQIAEGHRRRTFPDRIRFCVQARGSLSETLNPLLDAYDRSYIIEVRLNCYRGKISEIEKLLNGYISWLERQK